ncbi:extracellular solute-binding protein [Bradyrhizobium tropiciagri]|uniref:extracellular solute-binding protein n=1 Tax=Bradyrhizobium tropiciagri TaxID=312253 RepID=UPI001BA789E9|nr:extracellular solute-binding protein [Bradyrhizobium tropiciagri]MBR0873232.1 extracellular solute-binding protein [Bradyrhizobium tropiciagri]
MTERELLRIIDFVERVRIPFDRSFQSASPDATWNIILFLFRRTLQGHDVTKSSLASSSDIPFPSAMRRIHQLIADGDVDQIPRTPNAKATLLVPSQRLKAEFVQYALNVKSLLSDVWSQTTAGADPEDYYFGARNVTGQMAPPPFKRHPSTRDTHTDLRFLLHKDSYFASMRNLFSDFRNKFASKRNFSLLSTPDLHQALFAQANCERASFDIVSLDIAWLGEAVERGMIQALDPFLMDRDVNPGDFHPSVWAGGSWGNQQYGIPIYSTFETLAVRRDLINDQQIAMPTNFETVMEVARQTHDPKRGMSGIVWNAGKGRPVAQTFMFLLGACGHSVLNLPVSRNRIDYSKLTSDMYRPRFETEQAYQVLEYMHGLLKYSPPDILGLDATSALENFMLGRSAMIYCWGSDASRLEYDTKSRVKRNVDYLMHPRGPGGLSTSPVGGFLLAIPAKLPKERSRLAFDVISWMTSPSAMREHVKNGVPIAPCFSVKADPEMTPTTPIVHMVETAIRHNRLSTWQRPPIREYSRMERIIGQHVFSALTGEVSDQAALRLCQDAVDGLMRQSLRY